MAKKATNYRPDFMQDITPHLWFNGNCSEAIEFYKTTFGAELVSPVVPRFDGEGVMHAMLKIGDSNVMMADSWEGNQQKGPDSITTVGFFFYVKDVDAFMQNAEKSGCTIIDPAMDAFWGDRSGTLKDPFGHVWSVATFQWIYTEEEMAQKQKEWLDSFKQNEDKD